MANIKQTITPCLWFDNEAEEAANFYTSIFKDSQILETTHFSSETPSNKPVGSVMVVYFQIEGQKFSALNGGPFFKFSEAISFVVSCKSQDEIDYYWEKLSSDPKVEACGWLKDKFGVSWQIVPENIGELIKSEQAMRALLEMKKIDIAKLEELSHE